MISDTQNKELVFGPKTASRQKIKLKQRIDINLKFDNMKNMIITSVDEPEVGLKVFTDLNEDITQLTNIKVESGRNLDITVKHKRGKKTPDSHIYLNLTIPETFLGNLEIEGNVDFLTIYRCMHSHTGFSGEVNKLLLYDLKEAAEIDSNSHMEITYDGSLTQLDINQVNSSSNLILAKGANTYIYTNGKNCDVVLIGCVNNPNSPHRIELNGKNSHLIARNE